MNNLEQTNEQLKDACWAEYCRLVELRRLIDAQIEQWRITTGKLIKELENDNQSENA